MSNIGEKKRTIIVEPLELPEPLRQVPEREPAVVPAEAEPEKVPVRQE
jgi:hypothetical protein